MVSRNFVCTILQKTFFKNCSHLDVSSKSTYRGRCSHFLSRRKTFFFSILCTILTTNCKRLVNGVDYLELLLTEDFYDFTPFGLAMVDILRKLRAVRHACFGTDLLPNYQETLDVYQRASLNLAKDFSVNLILKDHIADYHLALWFQRHGVGLGASSEQTAESVHNIFANKYWDPRFKVAETSPRFPRQLLRAACAFNADRANFLTTDDK